MTGPDDRDRALLPDPGRLVAFVDAVVAIALTLLVLPLTGLVPAEGAARRPAITILTENLPVIGSFALSFLVIARFWVVHHRLFAHVGRLTHGLVWLNLLWLFTIVLLPFFQQLSGAYGSDPFVVRAYVGVLLACSAILTAMTLLMRRTARVDGDGSGPPESSAVRAIAATGNFGLVLVLVVLVPAAGYYALFLLFLDPVTTRVVARLRA